MNSLQPSEPSYSDARLKTTKGRERLGIVPTPDRDFRRKPVGEVRATIPIDLVSPNRSSIIQWKPDRSVSPGTDADLASISIRTTKA